MSLQIPARSGALRRLLLLGGDGGFPRLYSTGDRRRQVIREARQEEEDEAFLRTLNFGADPENNPLPPPPKSGRGFPDTSGEKKQERPAGGKKQEGPAGGKKQERPAGGKKQEGPAAGKKQEGPERSAQKAVGETLLEKLKLSDVPSATPAASKGGGTERPQAEDEPESAHPVNVDKIFGKMKETGLIPNAVAMLDGLCKNGLVQDAMKLFGLMREKGAIPEVVIYTAVVEGFCKTTKLDDAVRIFRKMQGNGVIPNAFSYWVLIQGLYKGGRLDDSVGFCVEMFEAGLAPNAETFVGLVDAICKKKGVGEGKKFVKSFQDRNFAIDEKSIREHLDKKGPFSPVMWEVIFGKRQSGRPF